MACFEALRLVDVFTRAGAKTFDLTLTALNGEKISFHRELTFDRFRNMLPALLDRAALQQRNVIVRPQCPNPGPVLVQLDDLTAEALDRVKPAAFLGLLTSPGNYQAWVAVSNPGDADFARRLRKGAGADPTASGATRIAGSQNFKEKYSPDFPYVRIAHIAPGLITTPEQLTRLGLVAPVEKPRARPSRVSPTRPGSRKWPSYQRCVENAPPNHGNTGPDISRADFTWCMTAIDWGWSIEEVAERLMTLSSKARENGEKYALLTAENAAAAVQRRRGLMAKVGP
jgi:hypothetical protein